MDIQLNFINNSNDANNSQIVIFQKNVASDFGELAVAWHVIQNCGQSENHPFTFPMSMQVGSSDSWGNYTPKLDAMHGQAFSVGMTASGDMLQPAGAATVPGEVQVMNALPQGSVSAGIYKMGRLLATKTGVAPGQMAQFQFKPTIWIGAVSQVVQGQVMNAAIIDAVNTEISLLGIASADIVMTGGGPGPTAQPFSFSLQNIVMA
ncbi:hypothetical protein P1X14_14595 [Sphingomonas sp. AOB5]|uniref:hypothetical protein n=1 Tax=Sphingomonas sp. AOB5 TaxID=3034017 RepID=UPI0023F66722|nr:hypothetical protein [Sphingomonas sp. AOB5]MDF7776481.1 hypothetical protein [Sphingomonas sp. AOB5]